VPRMGALLVAVEWSWLRAEGSFRGVSPWEILLVGLLLAMVGLECGRD
jgi:hypothetical protein